MRFTTLASLSLAALAAAVPYGITTSAEAKSVLKQLKVAASGSSTGYSLGQFGSLQMRTDICNTEEIVRWRDASTNAQVDGTCTLATGTWTSAWDGMIWLYNQPDKVVVERLVTPLNAWTSGASAWNASKRELFFNDLERPELWVVTSTLAAARGDKTPDAWKPPSSLARCNYAISWVNVKGYWGLSVMSAEKTALTSMLSVC